MNIRKNVICKISIMLSIIMMWTCFGVLTPVKASASVIDETVLYAERGAGGYHEETYSAPATNQVFQLVPTSYSIYAAKLTVELKRIDSGITGVWVEVVRNGSGKAIWSGFLNEQTGYKKTVWFVMGSGETYTVRTNVTGNGYVTVASSLWS